VKRNERLRKGTNLDSKVVLEDEEDFLEGETGSEA